MIFTSIEVTKADVWKRFYYVINLIKTDECFHFQPLVKVPHIN